MKAPVALLVGHPATHLIFHPGKVTSKSAVHIRWKHLREVESPGKELARCESSNGVRICQVQLKINLICSMESLFCICGDCVPNSSVRYMDRAKEVGRRFCVNSPEEGVSLLF